MAPWTHVMMLDSKCSGWWVLTPASGTPSPCLWWRCCWTGLASPRCSRQTPPPPPVQTTTTHTSILYPNKSTPSRTRRKDPSLNLYLGIIYHTLEVYFKSQNSIIWSTNCKKCLRRFLLCVESTNGKIGNIILPVYSHVWGHASTSKNQVKVTLSIITVLTLKRTLNLRT